VDTETKICTGCQQEKPLTEFFSRGGKLVHLYKSQCKLCMQAKRQAWAEQNRDHLNDWRRNNWVVLIGGYVGGALLKTCITLCMKRKKVVALCATNQKKSFRGYVLIMIMRPGEFVDCFVLIATEDWDC